MVLSLGSMASADWIPYTGDFSRGGYLVLSLGFMASADWIPYTGDLSLEGYLALSLGSMASRRLDSMYRGPFSRRVLGSFPWFYGKSPIRFHIQGTFLLESLWQL